MSVDIEIVSVLLNYFVQQSVSHGAMLFASVIALFYFCNMLIKLKSKDDRFPKNDYKEYRWFFNKEFWILFISGILLGSVFHILYRIIIYGYYSHNTILYADKLCSNTDITTYYEIVTDRTHERAKILAIYGNARPFSDFGTHMWLSFMIGISISFVLLWVIRIYDCEMIGRNLIIYSFPFLLIGFYIFILVKRCTGSLLIIIGLLFVFIWEVSVRLRSSNKLIKKRFSK